MSEINSRENPEKIWDIFIRIFHWALVAAIGFCWFSGEQGGDWMPWHQYSGFLVIALVVMRIVWGLIGSHHARFKNFLYSPKTTFRYLAALVKGKENTYQGHNPAGAVAVYLLLIVSLLQAGTGLFATDDIMFDGPLMQWVGYDLSIAITRIHKALFNGFLVLIAGHVLAVFYHQIFRKEKLLQAMFHGKK